MNKCSLVKDLFSLYEENLLSEESEEFVKEHLLECENCRAQFMDDNKDDPKPISLSQKEKTDLVFLAKSIKKEQFRYGRALVFLCLAVFFIMISILTKPISIEYRKDLWQETSTGQDDMLIFSKDVSNIVIEKDDRGIYIKANTNLWHKWFSKDQQISIPLSETLPSYYVNENKNAVLIRGESEDEGLIVLPSLVLNYYFLIASLLSIILLVILVLGWKKENRRWKLIAFAIPTSYILGSITIKGFSGVTFYPIRDFFWILLIGLCYFMIFHSVLSIKESKI